MPKRTSTHKLKLHNKKLQEHRDKHRDDQVKEYKKSAKDFLVTEFWDYEHRQLAREKYPAFLEHINERLREDPDEAEREKLTIMSKKLSEVIKK